MAETSRTPLVAMLVSAMAIVWPVVAGGSRSVTAGPSPGEDVTLRAGSHHDSKKDPEGPRAAGCCEPPKKPVCEPFPSQLTLHEKACDGAFAHFMDTVTAAAPIAPDKDTEGCWPIEGDGRDRFIALLPDPIDTGMRATFDEELVAVLKGFSEDRYLVDRFWSPWHDPRLSDDDKPGTVSACASRIPAVFTFRCRGSADGACRGAELFVVGENPTSGVDQDAFELALSLAGKGAVEGAVHVIGPTFSGSAESIAGILRSPVPLIDPDLTVALTTGSASVGAIRKTLTGARPGKVTFESFVLSSGAVEQGFLEYVRTRAFEAKDMAESPAQPGHDSSSYRWLRHVALFTEALTTFGKEQATAPSAQTQDSAPDAKPTDLGRARRTGDEAELTACSVKQPCFPSVAINFPLHVAALRTAFARQDVPAQDSSTIGSLKIPATALHLEQDLDSRDDTPRLLSKETSVLDDIVLEQQVQVLAEEDIRVAGIFASDPNDALFLVRHLRARLPDARLFVFDYDGAFEHPEYARDLRGTMLMSSYPSTSRADRWVYPYQESLRRAFTSPLATGVFNAAIWSVDAKTAADHLLAYGVPFAKSGGKGRPSLWVSAIGETGAVPVQALDAGDDFPLSVDQPSLGAGTSGCPDIDDQNLFPGSGFAGAMSLLALFFSFSSLCACGAVFGRKLPVTLRWISFLRPPPTHNLGYSVSWRLAAMAGAVAHFFAVIVLGVLVAVPLLGSGWCGENLAFSLGAPSGLSSWRGLLLVDAGLLGVAAIGGIVFVVAIWSRDPAELLIRARTSSRRTRWAVAAVTIGLVLASAYFLVAFVEPPSFYDAITRGLRNAAELPLTYARWTAMQSQLSPVAPFMGITAIVGIGASQYLMQAQRGGKHPRQELRRIFPFEKLELSREDVRRSASRNMAGVRDVILDGLSMRRFPFLAGAGLAAFVVVILNPARFGTLEHPCFTVFIGIGVALSFLLTVGTLSSSITLITALKLFLVRLDAHPIAERIVVVSSALSAPVRLPFSSLPDTQQQLRAWASFARAYVGGRAAADVTASWLKLPAADALEVSRGKDVLAMIRSVPSADPSFLTEAHEQAGGPSEQTPASANGEAARDFVAAHLLVFVFWGIRQLGTMAGFAIVNSLLFALVLASYPFRPARALSTLAAITVLTSLVVALVTFVMIERDSLLSKISGTTSGRIKWDAPFLAQLATWVLLPFLAFLATQYPDEARSLLGWASPYVPGK